MSAHQRLLCILSEGAVQAQLAPQPVEKGEGAVLETPDRRAHGDDKFALALQHLGQQLADQVIRQAEVLARFFVN